MKKTKNKNRILIISNCEDCPNYNHDDNNDEKKWGKSWCDKLDRELKPIPGKLFIEIPDDCPLPIE